MLILSTGNLNVASRTNLGTRQVSVYLGFCEDDVSLQVLK